ncbi:MAG TPA: hypothetical protein VGQ06_00185 [Gemmatimonadales bacterium]|jgi:hypothetical protein|nr:hypothetical protein [Gemmatimonadales bacterium]
MTPRLPFPGAARFAFTVMDDTDVATVENAAPIYRLLESLGMRTTKTAWPVRCEEGSRNFWLSETLDDPHYRDFVVDLHARGFEIAFHCATMETSTRGRTAEALEKFRRVFGAPPRVHANHALNRENLYWGAGRFDDAVLRLLYRIAFRQWGDFFQGHRPESPYWWGDFCVDQIEYVRNLTFSEINLLRVNPSMPYRDPNRPCVRWWFSASDAEDADEFNQLLRPENQQRLEAEGGVCIVATHFGKGFARDGKPHPETRRVLEQLATRKGWFPTVGELLDWLRARRESDALPAREWRRMQWRWARDLLMRRLAARRRRRHAPR